MAKERIPLHEWIAVAFFTSILLFVAIVNCIVNRLENSPIIPKNSCGERSVTLTGCVERPGTYRVEVGASLREVVAMAAPTPDADLRKLKRPIVEDMIVEVPALKGSKRAKVRKGSVEAVR